MKNLKNLLASLLFFIFVSQSVFATATNVNTGMNTNGDTAAVWQTYDITTGFNLGIRILLVNGSWSSITPLGVPAFVELAPKVSYNNLGQIVVIWSTEDDVLGLNALYYAYFDGASWITTGTRLSYNTENVFNNYNIELNERSSWAVITWSSFDSDALGNFDIVIRSCFGLMASLQGPFTIS